VAFVRLDGFSEQYPAPAELATPTEDGKQVTFVLVRWFSPHPDATERDSQMRPVCPGPLGVNHCKYVRAKTTRARRCISDNASWTRALTVLSIQPEQQASARADFAHARYEFLQVAAINAYVSMNQYRTWDSQEGAWSPDMDTFLETVVIP
jgi:hypothetical protein|tara:strand:- start:536 stop:988 length:453 start_codon:yes stop_codon:yes gene_type:complete